MIAYWSLFGVFFFESVFEQKSIRVYKVGVDTTDSGRLVELAILMRSDAYVSDCAFLNIKQAFADATLRVVRLKKYKQCKRYT